MFQLEFFVNNQERLYSKRPEAMGVPEGSVAMQVRICGFRRADQRGVFANTELQERSDTARSLLSLTKLYRHCQEVYFGSFFK